jgi:hypothetical protein
MNTSAKKKLTVVINDKPRKRHDETLEGVDEGRNLWGMLDKGCSNANDGVDDKTQIIFICLVLFPSMISHCLIKFAYIMNGILMTVASDSKSTSNLLV